MVHFVWISLNLLCGVNEFVSVAVVSVMAITMKAAQPL